MRNRMRYGLVAIVAMALAAVAAGPALAQDEVVKGRTECVGTLPPGAYERVVVPAGASCVILPGTVIGDFTIKAGAGAVEIAGAEITGNLKGSGFESLQLLDSSVGGNVGLAGITGFVAIGGTTVGGNLRVVESGTAAAPALFVAVGALVGNTVGGNLEVKGNIVLEDVQVANNQVAGNLAVVENTAGRANAARFKQVGGSLSFIGNEAGLNNAVAVNVVEKTLRCRDNVPPPIAPFANTAAKVDCEFAPVP